MSSSGRFYHRNGKHPWRRRLFTAAALLLLCPTATAIAAYELVCAHPCIDLAVLRDFRPDEGSRVYDRNGAEIGMLYRQNRRVVALKQIPQRVVRAFIDVEDKRFYDHGGMDLFRVPGAIIADVRTHRAAQGFSTITMQLARNAFPDDLPAQRKTLRRKLMEIRVARDIESTFSKDEILERYLNTIYLGAGAYGVDAAARAYFGVPVTALTDAQAAMLAALPKAPSRNNPYRNPKVAVERRNLALSLMRESGDLDDHAYRAAVAEPLKLAHATADDAIASVATAAPYFIEDVRRDLEDVFGAELYRGGLRIHTTLDTAIQHTAEVALETRLRKIESGEFGGFDGPRRDTAKDDDDAPGSGTPETAYLQGAVVILEAATGDVIALVGGRNFDDSKFDRATQALRQPGSAFKPFVYTAAVERGWSPYDEISDEAITVSIPGTPPWTPKNFDEAEADAPVITLATALRKSRNRATVRLSRMIGTRSVLDAAQRMGIASTLPRWPAVVLGSADVHIMEMVAAYTPFARTDGHTVRPRLITRVEDRDGKILYSKPIVTRAAISPAVAYVVRDMLQGVVNAGTAYTIREAGYTGPAAGKTGTTNSSTDAWFIGARPDLVAGVWIGFDKKVPIFHGRAATGGVLAAPIWAEIMKKAPPIADSTAERLWSAPEGVNTSSMRVAVECATPDTTTAVADTTADPENGDGSLPPGCGGAAVDSAAVLHAKDRAAQAKRSDPLSPPADSAQQAATENLIDRLRKATSAPTPPDQHSNEH